uniref:Uncharacterized protein n=1 Tax=Anguilla anguilla TaxID=7936 RepID=A0A0E9X8G6_ANGAN
MYCNVKLYICNVYIILQDVFPKMWLLLLLSCVRVFCISQTYIYFQVGSIFWMMCLHDSLFHLKEEYPTLCTG